LNKSAAGQPAKRFFISHHCGAENRFPVIGLKPGQKSVK